MRWPQGHTNVAERMSISSTLARHMTMEQPVSPRQRFTRAFLPWVVATGAIVLYLLTLSHWVTSNSLGHTAKVSGWSWQPEFYEPLYWLLTYPFHWLPARLIPLALNAFSAVCAALTLGLLARSVALLPHDRTHAQRQKEHGEYSLLSLPAAWLPPLLAVLVCGLQLTFWENATAASNEMLNLLLFAWVIRCLLEYRLEERDSWLIRAAFVYGLAMTNDWAMLGFLPAFLVALVWVKGLSFFNLRFLTRMALIGLAGMLLYLLLPLVQSLDHSTGIPFWPALKANVGSQTGVVIALLKNRRGELTLLSLTSLLPVFIMGIRWASYFGDSSPLGVTLATVMFHVVHGLFLIACVWVALDPPFSPRNKGFGLPFLTSYYLGALSVGYFSGYFLLVFGGSGGRFKRLPGYLQVFNTAVTSGIWLLLLLVPLALVYRNVPQIRTTNGPMLGQYAALLAQGLPTQGAVLLSDDARRLWLLQSLAARNGTGGDDVFLDTDALKYPGYHAYLKKTYQKRWPFDSPKDFRRLVRDTTIVRLIYTLGQSNTLYYAHPSFGYYFEFFYPEPHGLTFKLNPYTTNLFMPPPLTQAQIEENEAFWTKAEHEEIDPLLAAILPPDPTRKFGLVDGLIARAHLTLPPNREAVALGVLYSKSLSYWGVEMQKAGQLAQAAVHFDRAKHLNPNNRAAEINLDVNSSLSAGPAAARRSAIKVEDEFGPDIRNWDDALVVNGPYDEPNFCFQLGMAFLRGGNYRQGAAEFARAKDLEPGNLPARLWLGQLYVANHLADAALDLTEEIHSSPDRFALGRTNQIPLLMVETSAHLAKNDVPGAQAVVQRVVAKYPGDDEILSAATKVFITYGRYSNALQTVEQQLKIAPENPNALLSKGFVCIQLNEFDQAIPPLSKVISLQSTNYSALLSRAIAYLRSEQWDPARRDYEVLQKAFPTSYQIYFGLGEIAYRQKDTNAAVRNYQLYLANSPTNTPEFQSVKKRLQDLKLPEP